MTERKPYIRPQRPYWWARWPYRGYTLRELSGVGVALYGGILLAGLVALWLGPKPFGVYLGWLSGRVSMALHTLLLAAMLLHSVTWFQTLPKTMPRLIVRGRLVSPLLVTRLSILAALACSTGLVIGAWR